MKYYKYIGERYGPSLIFLDEYFNIHFIKGSLGEKLSPKDGLFERNIMHMLDQPLATVILNGIRRVKSEGKAVKASAVPLHTGDDRVFDITFSQAQLDDVESGYFLLEFSEDREEEVQSLPEPMELEDLSSQRIADLEYELKQKNDELRNLIEELETSNEELQSSNEELMASNEELQSTNEELQSVNEELYTVNAEMQQKNAELVTVYNDLSNLYASQDIATLFLDKNLHIRYFTPSIKKHFSLQESDIDRSIYDFMFFDQQTRELMMSELSASVAEGSRYEGHVTYDQHQYLLRISPFYNEEQIDGAVITLMDITDLRDAQQELAETNTRLQLSLDMEQMASWELDISTGAVSQYNEHWENIYEMDPENIIQQFNERIIHEDKEATWSQINEGLATGEQYSSTFRLRSKNGKQVKWISNTGQVVERDDAGKPLRIVGVSRDITHERQVENQFQALFDNINEAFGHGRVIKDDAGQVKDLELIAINPEFEKLTGLSASAAQGKRISNLIPKLFHEETDFLDILTKTADTEEPQKITTWVEALQKHLIVNIFSPKKGEVAVTFVDISLQKEAEKGLILAKEQAEEANKQKDLFLANLSHEIRTPMNGVLGFSKLLRKNGLNDESRDKFLRQIEENSNQLMTIIDDVLYLSKLESGQFTIIEEDVNIDELFQQLLENQAHQLEEHHSKKELLLQYSPQKTAKGDLWMKTDAVRLSQIVNNLLTNAIKFSKQGTIELGYEFPKNSDDIRIWVKDEGYGIPKKQQDAIFDRFTQVHEKLSNQMGGIGLGLSITNSIVEAMGGKVSLDSIYQKGSTFFVELPYVPGKMQRGDEGREIKKVIVADDSPSIQFYYKSLLGRYDLDIFQAFNGQEVLDLCKEHEDVDIILMDMRMPVMDGPTSLKELRKFNTEVMVVGQSAFAMPEQVERYLKEGFDDYFTKPIEEEALLRLLKLG